MTYLNEIPHWLRETWEGYRYKYCGKYVTLDITIDLEPFCFYSIYGGFVRWQMGEKEDGTDSIAIQVADENVRDARETIRQMGLISDL